MPPDRPDDGITEVASDPRGLNALRDSIDPKLFRDARKIPCKPVPFRIEQPRKLNAPGILLKMILDGGNPLPWRQRSDEIDLDHDHAIRARDQIVINLPVDEPEQRDDEDRKHGRYRRSPAECVRAYELHLKHRISPPNISPGTISTRHHDRKPSKLR